MKRIFSLVFLVLFSLTVYHPQFSYNPIYEGNEYTFGYSNDYVAYSPWYPDVKYSYRAGNYASNKPYSYGWTYRDYQGFVRQYH